MRTRIGAVVAIALMLLLPSLASATDYVSNAVNALQNTNVYVAPSDIDTTARLQRALSSDDGIVLVILPADAAQGTTVSTLAISLSSQLGNKKIVGLAVGRDVAAIGSPLPDGVASDMMRRANSVSNDSTTALVTFAQNIHVWQSQHPAPQPTLPAPAPSGTPLWVGALVVILIALGGLTALTFMLRDNDDNSTRHFDVPSVVSGPLKQLYESGKRIRDTTLEYTVEKMCSDIEIYFKGSLTDKRKSATFFRERIEEVNGIVAKYLRVQDNSEYHNNPKAIMQLGKDAILDFAQYIVQEIRKGNDEDMGSFKINAHTLEAYREMGSDDYKI